MTNTYPISLGRFTSVSDQAKNYRSIEKRNSAPASRPSPAQQPKHKILRHHPGRFSKQLRLKALTEVMIKSM